MPYDPDYPQDGQLIDATDFRNQFHGLKELIDAAPGLTGVVVDGVSTLNPGEPATVNLSVVGGTLHLSFGIPRGSDGSNGTPGPPFAQAVVDGVSTLNPGEPATAQAWFDGNVVHFTFGLPRGADGVQGPPGEVSAAQLASAIGGTSSNSNGVGTLDSSMADPDDEALRQKVNELILALRR